MSETKKMTVKQYADHRMVTRQTVYKNIRNGQLSKSVVTVDGKMKIIPELADKELSENLDQIYNRPENRTSKGEQKARLEIQEAAVDVASDGEHPGYIHPWPIWAARYVGELFNLDPERVTVERISKTEWRLRVEDIDNEDGEPCPWAVTMTFDLKPDG